MDMRAVVINDAVEIEASMSNFLAKILKIEVDQQRKELPLEYLPFEHKCLILKDMAVIPKELFIKLTFFAEIRNKFCHNIHIKSLEDSLGHTSNGRLKKLTQLYPPDPALDAHEQLHNIYARLTHELKHFCSELKPLEQA